MNRFTRWSAALILFPAFVAAAPTIQHRPAPEWPGADQTATWTPPANVLTVDRFPEKQPLLEKSINTMIQKTPERMGLPKGVNYRIDSIQIVPEATGIDAMAFVRLTQVVDNTPVSGGEAELVFQWRSKESPLRYTSGRFFPDLKNLPEKAINQEEAERKVWERLSTEITRFETKHAGTFVRWINGAWKTVQVYGVSPQSLIAAVDGSGAVHVWQGRVVGKTLASKEPGPKPL
jgi:hypothetical protein